MNKMLLNPIDVPIGTILDYTGQTIPSDYMECNGAAISRVAYSELFKVIGVSWGGEMVPQHSTFLT